MHEMSLAGSILRLVEDASRRERFRRIATLRLAAGRLAGVEVASLRFALEALAPGTCLEGATVEIDEPPGQGRCLRCHAAFEVEARGAACPRCGSDEVQAFGGDQLRVVELMVEDD